MNIILRGRNSWVADGLAKFGIVSIHQGHNFEVEFTSETTEKGIWSMADRLFFPSGEEFSLMIGYGHYRGTYEKIDHHWKIKTSRITRLRVESQ